MDYVYRLNIVSQITYIYYALINARQDLLGLVFPLELTGCILSHPA